MNEIEQKQQDRKWRAEAIVNSAMKNTPTYKQAIQETMKELEITEGKAEAIILGRAVEYQEKQGEK